MRTLYKYSFYLLLLFLMSCQQNAPAETVGVQLTPPEIVDVDLARPMPTETRQTHVFAVSEPGTATIHSHLLVLDPMLTAPDPDTPDPIFLVPLPADETGILTVPTFEIEDVQQADVDESTGEFVFTNIEPGRYIVMVLLIGGAQIPATDDSTGNMAIITIDDSDLDQVIEMGVLSVP